MLTHEKLISEVRYDPKEGQFYWLTKNNRHEPGQLVGYSANERGYHRWKIWIDNHLHYRSRLAMFYVRGTIPTKMVDHINGDTLDDRISNLREVSNTENQWNQLNSHTDSKIKFIGVSLYRKTGKYQAKIRVNKKDYHLGYFDNPECAWETYKKAKRELHGIVL